MAGFYWNQKLGGGESRVPELERFGGVGQPKLLCNRCLERPAYFGMLAGTQSAFYPEFHLNLTNIMPGFPGVGSVEEAESIALYTELAFAEGEGTSSPLPTPVLADMTF